MIKQWRGRGVTKARLALADRTPWPTPCARCGRPLRRTDPWHLGHIIGRDEQPQLTWSPSNWQIECQQCSSSSGASYGNRKRAAMKGNRKGNENGNEIPFLLPRDNPAPAVSILCPVVPDISGIGTPFTKNSRNAEEFDGTPLVFPDPHSEAVDSFGDIAVEWIEGRMRSDRRTHGDGLRWWQWLVLQRLLEVRADGSMCWPVSFCSVSRQSGKSELLCELAAWRCAHPDLFGGWPQEVGHSANTVVLARKVQASRWQWAEDRGLTIGRQMGDSRVEWEDGSTWRTMAPENMYGRSLDMVLADEAWHWDASNFWQATFPTMAERPQSQAVLFSAAHDDPGSLVGTLFGNKRVALMVWGAPREADVRDPEVWRKASAFWSRGRRDAMDLAKDQTSFATQWLNVWPDLGGGSWLPPALLSECAVLQLQQGQPAVGALECDMSGRKWSAAVSDGAGNVAVFPSGSLEDAARWLKHQAPPVILANPTVIARMPQDVGPARGIGTRENQAAVSVLDERVRAGAVRWDHGEAVAEHFAAAVVVNSDGGPKLFASKSRGDVSLVKVIAAVVWHVSQKREPTLV